MKKSIVYIFFLSIAIIAGCDDGFEALNENPLSPTEAQDGAIFNNIVSSLRLGWNRQLFLHNEKLYDITELAVVTAETFNNVESGAEDVWTNYYTALKDARELESRFAQYEDPEISDVMSAQLKILMAYKTFQITDLFGSIPYSEAGRAYDSDVVLRPQYDEHETIYRSLIEDLSTASSTLANLGATTSQGNKYQSFGAFETLFNNNNNQWQKFANSMLLRYLVRIYDKDPAYVDTKIKTLFDTGASFINPGEDVVMSPRDQNWSNQGVNWSFREHNKIRLGSNMWNYMTEDNDVLDPRLLIFFEPNNNGDWIPFPQVPQANTPQSGGEPYSNRRDQSYDEKGAGNIYASVNYYLIRDENDIPEILMSSAEVKFLIAEILVRGIGIAADQNTAWFRYVEGLTQSIKYWQNIMLDSEIWINQAPFVDDIAISEVYKHPKYDIQNITDEDEKLRRIYAQRWIDAFRQPWEAFALIRRTNALPREKEGNTFNRFKYPPSEQLYNNENYNDQVAKMGGDDTTIKMWWQE